MKDFIQFFKTYKYWRALIFYLPMVVFILIQHQRNNVIEFFIFILLPIIFIVHLRQTFLQYKKFTQLVESEDFDLYLKDVKADGRVNNYAVTQKSDVLFKNGKIFWFSKDTSFLGQGTVVVFCLTFDGTIDKSITSNCRTVKSWYITNRGNLKLKGQGKYLFDSNKHNGVELHIFSHIQDFVKYLPVNLKIN